MDDDYPFEGWREFAYIYVDFIQRDADAAEGYLEIVHPRANQNLIVPVHPSDGVPDIVPLVEPAFAHYAEQWRLLAPSLPLGSTGTSYVHGFYLEADELPSQIADPEQAKAIELVYLRHASASEAEKVARSMYRQPGDPIGLNLRVNPLNWLDFCKPLEETGISRHA
jgi:hypothetical protein